jgi:hypothetical protein
LAVLTAFVWGVFAVQGVGTGWFVDFDEVSVNKSDLDGEGGIESTSLVEFSSSNASVVIHMQIYADEFVRNAPE